MIQAFDAPWPIIQANAIYLVSCLVSLSDDQRILALYQSQVLFNESSSLTFFFKIKKYWVLTKRFYLHIGVWYVDGEDESITRRNRASCMLFSTWPITKINQFSSMENSSTRFKVITIQAWSRNGQRINGNDWSPSVWTLPSFFFFLLQVDWIYKAIMASILKLKTAMQQAGKIQQAG